MFITHEIITICISSLKAQNNQPYLRPYPDNITLNCLLGIDYQKLVDIYVDIFERPKTKGLIHGPTYGFKMCLSYTSEFHFIFFIHFIFIMIFSSSFHFSGSCFTNGCSHVPNMFCMHGILPPNGGAHTTFREGQAKLCYSLQFPDPKKKTIALFCGTEFKELGEP